MSNEKKIKVIPGAKSGLAHESPSKSHWENTSFYAFGKTWLQTETRYSEWDLLHASHSFPENAGLEPLKQGTAASLPFLCNS